jgi:hypothetical protein
VWNSQQKNAKSGEHESWMGIDSSFPRTYLPVRVFTKICMVTNEIYDNVCFCWTKKKLSEFFVQFGASKQLLSTMVFLTFEAAM